MRTRYRFSMGEVALDQLIQEDYPDKLWILDISYAEPAISRSVETPANRDGGIITKEYRQKASVTVTFGLYIYDTAERNAACDRIKSWAKAGGNIRTNDKPDLVLQNAVCEQYPEIDSAKNWTDPLTMTFSAFTFPYWQDFNATTKTLSGTKTSGTITVPGNADYTNPTVSITANAAVTWFEVSTDATTIRVNASLAKNETATISYNSKGYLQIRRGTTSILSSRSANSADELRLPCGKTSTIKINASARITATFTARGAWL